MLKQISVTATLWITCAAQANAGCYISTDWFGSNHLESGNGQSISVSVPPEHLQDLIDACNHSLSASSCDQDGNLLIHGRYLNNYFTGEECEKTRSRMAVEAAAGPNDRIHDQLTSERSPLAPFLYGTKY